MKTKLLTIMFIDIVNYTYLTSKLKRHQFEKLHFNFDSISFQIVEKFQGNLIKKIGDSFLITFESATNAVLCGIELQKNFAKYNLNTNEKIKIKIGIDVGEVSEIKNDVYGEAVNRASRIQGAAKQGDVVFSSTVNNIINRNELEVIKLNPKNFKGVPKKISLYRVKKVGDDKFIRKRIRTRKFKKLKLFFFDLYLNIVYLIVVVYITLILSFILL